MRDKNKEKYRGRESERKRNENRGMREKRKGVIDIDKQQKLWKNKGREKIPQEGEKKRQGEKE